MINGQADSDSDSNAERRKLRNRTGTVNFYLARHTRTLQKTARHSKPDKEKAASSKNRPSSIDERTEAKKKQLACLAHYTNRQNSGHQNNMSLSLSFSKSVSVCLNTSLSLPLYFNTNLMIFLCHYIKS